MSRKISDFFKVKPNSSIIELSQQTTLDQNSTRSQIGQEIQSSQVVLNDLRNEPKFKDIKLFEEVSIKHKQL